MTKMFNWHRKPFSSKDYENEIIKENDPREFTIKIQCEGKAFDTTVTVDSDLLNAVSGSSKLQNAYTQAADIRKFEIGLFWHRAAFFWAFIVAIYTAYFNVLKEKISSHGSFPVLALSALGLFFCFSWLLSSKGSKHWQEKWENHLELLEDDITCPLYKTYKTKSYSESKIAITAGWVVTVYAYGLLLYEVLNFTRSKLNGQECLQFAFALAFAVIVVVCLFCYSRLVLGNVSDCGEISFNLKKYEEV